MNSRAVLLVAAAAWAAACGAERTELARNAAAGSGAEIVAFNDPDAPPIAHLGALERPERGDTLQHLLARLAERTAPLPAWRARGEATLRPDSGAARADSTLLRLREDLRDQVQRIARTVDGPEFQAAIWPDGAYGQRLRRAGSRSPAGLEEVSAADSIARFLARQGIRTVRSEGTAYLEASEEVLLRWFGRFATEPMRQFLRLQAVEQAAPTAGDAALMVTPDELAARLAATDRLFAEHPESAAREMVETQHRWYLAVYLGGLENSPAFDRRTGAIDSGLRRSLERYVGEHGGTASGVVVAEYLTLLQAHGYRDAPPVREFRRARPASTSRHRAVPGDRREPEPA